MSRLVVKSHRPWQFSIAVITLSMLIAGITWLLLDSSHWSLITERISGNDDIKSLLQENRTLEQKNRELQGQVMMLRQTTEVDTHTASLLQQEMKAQQDELFLLKQELEFYRGVMDSTRAVIGLDVHGLYVEPLARAGNYRMKLVLTHVARNDKPVQGNLNVQVEGTTGNSRRKLDIKDISIDKPIDMNFKFKNFNRLEYSIALPGNFTAERVFVQVKSSRKNDPVIDKVYDWPVTTDQETL